MPSTRATNCKRMEKIEIINSSPLFDNSELQCDSVHKSHGSEKISIINILAHDNSTRIPDSFFLFIAIWLCAKWTSTRSNHSSSVRMRTAINDKLKTPFFTSDNPKSKYIGKCKHSAQIPRKYSKYYCCCYVIWLRVWECNPSSKATERLLSILFRFNFGVTPAIGSLIAPPKTIKWYMQYQSIHCHILGLRPVAVSSI